MNRRGAGLAWFLLGICTAVPAAAGPIEAVAPPAADAATGAAQPGSAQLLPMSVAPELAPLFEPPDADEGDPGSALPPPIAPVPVVAPSAPADAPAASALPVAPVPGEAGTAAAAPPPTAVTRIAIDIAPGRTGPSVVTGRGRIRVAALGSESFDASEIAPETLAFGPGHARIAAGKPPRLADVNGDGRVDLVARFEQQDADFDVEYTRACLEGQTRTGTAFKGCADVRVTP